jgi:outer membrane protein TolC
VNEAGRLLYRDLAAAFYSALQAEANVATWVDTAALGHRRLDEVRARNEVGLARRTEVLLVESQLAADESSLVRARNDAAVARDVLARLAGTPVDRPLKDTLELPADVGAVADESGALANRSDLLALERDVEAARRIVRVARGEYFPVIDLEADWYLWRKNYSTFQQETDWTAQVNFTFPLFQGGRIRASVATAESRLRQAELRREELEREIRQEVRAAALLVSTDAGLLRTAEARVASADENLRLVSEEYRNDLATNLEVYSAQNQLLAGRLELDRQRNQLKLDWLALRTAQGLLPAGEPLP